MRQHHKAGADQISLRLEALVLVEAKTAVRATTPLQMAEEDRWGV